MNRKRTRKAYFLHVRMSDDQMIRLKERRAAAGYGSITGFVCDVLVNSREDSLIKFVGEESEARKAAAAQEGGLCSR